MVFAVFISSDIGHPDIVSWTQRQLKEKLFVALNDTFLGKFQLGNTKDC